MVEKLTGARAADAGSLCFFPVIMREHPHMRSADTEKTMRCKVRESDMPADGMIAAH
jgi:hypothetical protein